MLNVLGAYQGRGGKVVKFGSRQTNPNTYVVGATEGVTANTKFRFR